MTPKQAEYFLQAYELKNIASAANRLFVSRSVVSRAILDLEGEVGEPLFARSKEGVEPTKAGTLLYRMLREFESGYANTMERIRSLNSEDQGRELSLCVTPTNVLKLTDMLLGDFCACCPDVRLRVTERPAHAVMNMLINREADIGFTPSREQLPAMFCSLDVFQSRIVMGLCAEHPLARKPTLTIADILELPLGYLDAPMPVEDILVNCYAAFGKEPKVVIRTSQLDVLRRLTQQGIIAPVLPDEMIENWENVTAVPMDFFARSTHRLVWDKTKRHNSAFDDFIRFTEQKLEELRQKT